MAEDIEKLRREIDAVDDELAALIQRRAGLAQRIGALKQGAPAYRPEREAEIVRRVSGKTGTLSAERIAAVFREIISACRGLEEAIRVSYLGPEGTFSEQAMRKHFGRAVEALPAASVDEAFRRCEAGGAQFTVVPVENSTEGAVGRTLDLLLATPLRICGEVELRVHQNLLSRARDMSAVRRIYSHAQSLAQCNAWLSQNLPAAERIPVASNAEAARRVGMPTKRVAASVFVLTRNAYTFTNSLSFPLYLLGGVAQIHHFDGTVPRRAGANVVVNYVTGPEKAEEVVAAIEGDGNDRGIVRQAGLGLHPRAVLDRRADTRRDDQVHHHGQPPQPRDQVEYQPHMFLLYASRRPSSMSCISRPRLAVRASRVDVRCLVICARDSEGKTMFMDGEAGAFGRRPRGSHPVPL